MSSDRIKVPGYSQKVLYNNNVEWRPFSPDLVGFQLASNGGTPLFTIGNFAITTNLDPKLTKFYITKKFSNFITLSDLSASLTETKELLTDNATAILNLDKTNLKNYALFGSLTEFIRVSLENVITNWPASLYTKAISQLPTGEQVVGYTFEDYTYDSLTEISSFKINNTFIDNKFQLNILSNGTILNTYNETNDLRNVTINYASYVVYYNNTEYPVIGFTGATAALNSYVYFSVKGNPFSGMGITSRTSYHIKPEKLKENLFFNKLPDFGYYLLNRQVLPLYTASFKYPIKTEQGTILYVTQTLTWPVSDGYNIDFNTTQYENYASNLLDIATKSDLSESNLMNRFLVSESITSFDTTPVRISEMEMDNTGQKVNKLLQIYGVEYDNLNNYINGIAFSNVVSYDKLNNTPDIYLKNIARVLGWEIITSVVENDLLKNYVQTSNSSYSGLSVGLTPVEADIELWRRIILNTPWLWKSKGTRKAIEFLIKFIGAPDGLITFNEHVYKADGPIDVELFKEILVANGLTDDITNYPIDSEGYPAFKPNTNTMYFQNNGLWYRETGGTGSTLDLLTGNNPHLGPYDRGSKYINQIRGLIPNFSAVTITSTTTTTKNTNLYTNYDMGKFDYSGLTATTVTSIEIFNDDGSDISNYAVFTPSIIKDPNPIDYYNECGCNTTKSDNILSVCIEKLNQIPTPQPCSDIASVTDNTNEGLYVFNYYQYDTNGNQLPQQRTSNFSSKQCCQLNNGTPAYYNQIVGTQSVNDGYVCCTNNRCGCTLSCKWKASTTNNNFMFNINGANYLIFYQSDGNPILVTPDGCNCDVPDYYSIEENMVFSYPNILTAVPNITDPYTGEVGFACRLNYNPMTNFQVAYQIRTHYLSRYNGSKPCY